MNMGNKIKKTKYAELIHYLFREGIISAEKRLFLVEKLKAEEFDSVESYFEQLLICVDGFSAQKIRGIIGGKQ
jgi:hypothetical protein